MSAAWSQRSSTGISSREATAIRFQIRSTFEKSRRTIHSPSRGVDVVEVGPTLHLSKYLGQTVRVTSLASKRRALRRFRSATPGVTVRAVGNGRYGVALKGREHGVYWIGHVLVVLRGATWWIADACGPCRVSVRVVDAEGVPRCHHFVFADDFTTSTEFCVRNAGRVLAIRVGSINTCHRPLCVEHAGGLRPALDAHVVRYWHPWSNIIYGYASHSRKDARVLARKLTDDTLQCLYCGKEFGRSKRLLCAHLRVPPDTIFTTHNGK
jgi:hypothetical protein